MKKKLTPEEVIYDIRLDNNDFFSNRKELYYNEIYKILKASVEINKRGYNVYIIDQFDKEKMNILKEYVEKLLKDQSPPNDICYVTEEDSGYAKKLLLGNGKGNLFIALIDEIKDYFGDMIFDFYNNSVSEEKEKSMISIENERASIIEKLLRLSQDKGFSMKVVNGGFTFIPIKDNAEMTEEEYDKLSEIEKNKILDSVTELKNYSKELFKSFKDTEIETLNKLKIIFGEYLMQNTLPIKNKYKEVLINNDDAKDFCDRVCSYIENSAIDNFTMNYEDDEEKIINIINKFKANLIVDNSKNKTPICIFEENPTINNLVGTIKYDNNNGIYHTDVTLVKAGSLLAANNGFLMLRAEDILSNITSYYCLKKCLLNEKVNISSNLSYADVFSLNSLELEPIPVNIKIILIGNFETYSLLYKYDNDFKILFKLKGEYNPIIKIDADSKKMFIQNINEITNKNNINELSKNAFKELFKYSSRTAENRNKIYFNNDDMDKVIMMSNLNSISKNKDYIDRDDIIDVLNKKDIIETDIIDNYKENKQLIDINNNIIGQINGLSVIDLGYHRFGKPIRITCSCYYGYGNIFDVQKESDLGSDIYKKSSNTLKGCISNVVGCYNKQCVDFHINFEQLYGFLDGDSASAAEIVVMISALCRIPIKQNIAITGSIDQFGNIQPVGGINEKIEGFYDICNNLDSVKNKGVIIPKSNIDNIILNGLVESSVSNNEFSIYAVDDIFDALEILTEKNKADIIELCHEELKKYSKGKNK